MGAVADREDRSGSGALTPAGNFLLVLASLVIVVAGLRAAEALLLPLLVSIFLAMLGFPLLTWLRDRKVPLAAAVLIVVLVLLVVFFIVAIVVGSSFADFSAALPRYQTHLQELTLSLETWLLELGVEMKAINLLELFDAGAVMQLVGMTLRSIASVLSNTVLVILTIVFILLEGAVLPQKLRLALGAAGADLNRLSRFTGEVQRYLVIKTSISLVTGIVLAIWLFILGIDFPVLWGALAFLLNFIPNLGSIIAGVPPMLLAMVQHGPGTALLVIAGYLTVNMVLGNFVEPQLMGRKLGLSVLVVFLSLVFWGWVWGPLGMILSVPLTMILKILFENSDELRWIAVLMGSGSEVEEQTPKPDRAG